MSSAVKDQEIAAEQERVDVAYARLEEMREDAKNMIKEGYRQAQAGTKASLVDRDAMVHQAALRVQALNIADDGLVFGRLDLTGGEARYVGRVGVRTRDHDSLVIDWRAPAAEAFYQATPEDPREVIRRRVLHSRGDRVIDIEDDLLDPGAADGLTIVGDGAFLASLARTREGPMRDIVATIQREQDEVIRAPADGTVIVRGGPGTGKTAVALHRVAYLLFRHRRRFGSRGVLIVGPNPRFTSYIRRVLPSLGEGSATLRSLGDLVEGVTATAHDTPELAAVKGAGSMARVLRRAVTDHPPGAADSVTVVHAGVVVRLDRSRLDRVRQNVHRRSRGNVNTARGRAGEQLVDALWNRFVEIGGLSDAAGTKRSEFAANIRDQRTFTDFLATWWPVRRPLDVLLSLGDAQRLSSAAGRDLSGHQVGLLAASWSAEAARTYQDVALLDEIDNLLGAPPRTWAGANEDDEDPYASDGINIFTGERTGSGQPAMRELTTTIERMERARRVDDGVEESREYAHIVVDEAQDLSPMQWRMLGRRGRQATWTVVEDPAQSAWEDLDASRQAMDAALGSRARRDFALTTNYRNSVEIADVAARVLTLAVPGAVPARAVRASGYEPAVTVTGSGDLADAVREAVTTLLDQVEGTIGVIVPLAVTGPAEVAASAVTPQADGQIALPIGDQLPRSQSPAGTRPGPPAESRPETAAAASGRDRRALVAGFPDRVQVLDVLEAKGLEFDAAVIVAPEEVAVQSPRGLRTLYVAVSRATQRLTVLTADPHWRDLLDHSPA
ncbi:HelD family protein [Actinomadura alba]|uniref:AAA family ATPase n=1 Tax=Actinomadura alba TaxID=406431 RepID=A0ABR7LIY7_9ACTN|nr:AAA family ATPase [Actinomadura alba]MBC6464753.1 AAA family ATPase [Actinomadura alba]